MSTRYGVLTGQTILLKVIVTDDSGNPVNTDALPDVYIYDASIDDDTIDSEIEAETYASAIDSGTATNLATGFYQYSYTVPSGAEEGEWKDIWVGTIDTVNTYTIQKFLVTAGGQINAQQLFENEVILIELDSSIANEDGDLTLGEDITLSFNTQYNPFYSDVMSVRMEGGPLIQWVPDDTLALMIFWSSLEARNITPKKVCDLDQLCFAQGRFVILDVALRALMSPGGSFVNGFTNLGGESKTLGELSIKKGSNSANLLSGGLDLTTYKEMKKNRDEWWRVINSGACLVPGQGLAPLGAIRGLFDPARRPPGRLWEDPYTYPTPQPVINTRSNRTGQRHYRHGFDYSRYNYTVDARY